MQSFRNPLHPRCARCPLRSYSNKVSFIGEHQDVGHAEVFWPRFLQIDLDKRQQICECTLLYATTQLSEAPLSHSRGLPAVFLM